MLAHVVVARLPDGSLPDLAAAFLAAHEARSNAAALTRLAGPGAAGYGVVSLEVEAPVSARPAVPA